MDPLKSPESQKRGPSTGRRPVWGGDVGTSDCSSTQTRTGTIAPAPRRALSPQRWYPGTGCRRNVGGDEQRTQGALDWDVSDTECVCVSPTG